MSSQPRTLQNNLATASVSGAETGIQRTGEPGTKRQVVQFEYRQALAYDSERPGWSEVLDISVRLTSAALTSGWLREYFAGRGNDFLVLLAIVMHARPLDGDDLDLLVRMGMAVPGDRCRLYARVTGMALAEELGMSRNTVRSCARRLVDLNLVAERDIPDGLNFRDSHGKFDGVKVYLLSGAVQNWLAKDIQNGAQLLGTGVDGAQLLGTVAQNGAQNLSSAQELGTDTPLPLEENPAAARKNCAEGAQDLTTNMSQVNVVVFDPVLDPTTDSDSDAQIKNLNAALLAKGVYAHTAADLLRGYDRALIQEWLALYDAACSAGLVSGPGWLVDALQKDWEIEKIRQQIGRQQTPRIEPAPLPENLLDELAEIGWCGPLDELARHYTADPQRFEDWLAYIRSNKRQFTRPAGILLNNLRVGIKAPKAVQDRYAFLYEHEDDWEEDFVRNEAEDDISGEKMPEAVCDAWEQAMLQLRSEIAPNLFNTWVRDIQPLRLDEQEGILEIGVVNAYAREWLEERVSQSLSRILQDLLNCPVRAVFITIG